MHSCSSLGRALCKAEVQLHGNAVKMFRVLSFSGAHGTLLKLCFSMRAALLNGTGCISKTGLLYELFVVARVACALLALFTEIEGYRTAHSLFESNGKNKHRLSYSVIFGAVTNFLYCIFFVFYQSILFDRV